MSEGRVHSAGSLADRVREAALLEGDFVLSSGERSRYYLDKYLFATQPELLRDMSAELARGVPGDVERLAGVELGAVPLVVALSLATGLPYVIVRRASKEYGASSGRKIEGHLQAGERLVLIEDVVTTGTQALAALETLRETGVEVRRVLAVLDRREPPAGGLGGIELLALLKMADLGVPSGD